jgi:hypothetical protein
MTLPVMSQTEEIRKPQFIFKHGLYLYLNFAVVSFHKNLWLIRAINNMPQLNFLCYAMLRKERERESESIRERIKVYTARDFSFSHIQ